MLFFGKCCSGSLMVMLVFLQVVDISGLYPMEDKTNVRGRNNRYHCIFIGGSDETNGDIVQT